MVYFVYQWVITHMYESCLVCMSHVSHECVVSLINKMFLMWMSRVSYQWVITLMYVSYLAIWRTHMFKWMSNVTYWSDVSRVTKYIQVHTWVEFWQSRKRLYSVLAVYEASLMSMLHVSYKCVLTPNRSHVSRMNEAWHFHIQVPLVNVLCDSIYVTPRTRIYMNLNYIDPQLRVLINFFTVVKAITINICVACLIWRSHVSHMNVPCLTYRSHSVDFVAVYVACFIQMSPVSYMNESRLVYRSL